MLDEFFRLAPSRLRNHFRQVLPVAWKHADERLKRVYSFNPETRSSNGRCNNGK
jgi:hypothetical protein